MKRVDLTDACPGSWRPWRRVRTEVDGRERHWPTKGDVRVLDGAGPDVSGTHWTTPRPRGCLSCVESYAPKAVMGRAFAFDRVVVEVGCSVSDRADEAYLRLPGVTFGVREWSPVAGTPRSRSTCNPRRQVLQSHLNRAAPTALVHDYS